MPLSAEPSLWHLINVFEFVVLIQGFKLNLRLPAPYVAEDSLDSPASIYLSSARNKSVNHAWFLWHWGSNPELDKPSTNGAALQALRNVWELSEICPGAVPALPSASADICRLWLCLKPGACIEKSSQFSPVPYHRASEGCSSGEGLYLAHSLLSPFPATRAVL